MISMQDVYGAFVGSFGLTVRMLGEVCQVRSVEIEPKPGTPLHVPGAPGATCRVPLDTVIAPPVIVAHAWDAETARRAHGIVAERAAAATLVDIGANSGLFSRQMLAGGDLFRHAFAYEPHPGNFDCLRHNLAPFAQATLRNCALGAGAGTLAFHLDPGNCGNYSLNPAAMPAGEACASIAVEVRAAAAEAEDWLAAGLPVFYKSDTQGHDEIIATAIAPAFWDRVIGGLFELWRIDKPAWSGEAMRVLLDRFPNKRFLRAPDTPLSTAQVLAYLAGNDGASHDVLFWK
jgi:FkbM family methyltransferase